MEGVRRWPPGPVGRPGWSVDHGSAPTSLPFDQETSMWALITFARGIASNKLVSPLWWAHGSSRLRLIGREEIAFDR